MTLDNTAESVPTYTRLSVNINDDCAEHLKVMQEQGVTATEVIRQAIALHKFVQGGGRVLPPADRSGS